ncbi:MAG: carbamoyltransferase HypF [Prochlorococcaceae cyanobacterium]|jgi:hydrogenase maturation protein HypF
MAFQPEAGLTLHCRGVVQGVGFRPWVHHLAAALALRGSAENLDGAVRLALCGRRADLERFLERLPRELPAPARLESLEARWEPPPAVVPSLPGVRIRHAAPRPLGEALFAVSLPADRAPCPACLAELADPANRRHRYPFISCSRCGPRFSIATAEPYARAHTTLAALPPCPACQREFSDPADRRFHAETISCPACGPRLRFQGPVGMPEVAAADPIEAASVLLAGGGILALQGVGGFQLLVDATAEAAVQRLRRRKRRPAKPLALLVADPGWLAGEVRLDPAERQSLEAAAAPIVLMQRCQPSAAHPLVAASVAPGSPLLGVMLPASPLHWLLSRACGRPLVATSGNPSGEPLCLDPTEALERLGGIADGFLTHSLPIARRLDDSVLQLIEGRPVLLRRARGYAPEPLQLPEPPPLPPEQGVLALGGDLKAAPALARGGRVWLAAHLGDLADAASLERLRRGVAAELAGSGAGSSRTTLLCDGHPEYRIRRLAEEFADAPGGVALQPVPHHLAHGLAVLAEHGLGSVLQQEPLLVLACDGLGAAPPGAGAAPPALWGCELLLLQAAGPAGAISAQRLAGLRPFPLPGGDRAAVEPRRAALGWLTAGGAERLDHPGAVATRRAFRPCDRALLQQAIAAGCNCPWSSGLGRLFDAVASLLDLRQRISFEGEGGLALQALATPAGPSTALPPPYPLPLVAAPAAAELPLGWLDWEPLQEALLAELAADLRAPEQRQRLAARFHATLIGGLTAMATAAAPRWGARRVLLAGGCFQNRLLLEGCARALRAETLEPLWSEQVPCSDAGLALGQIWAVAATLATTKAKPTHPPQRAHVPGPAWSHPLDRTALPPLRVSGAG